MRHNGQTQIRPPAERHDFAKRTRRRPRREGETPKQIQASPLSLEGRTRKGMLFAEELAGQIGAVSLQVARHLGQDAAQRPDPKRCVSGDCDVMFGPERGGREAEMASCLAGDLIAVTPEQRRELQA